MRINEKDRFDKIKQFLKRTREFQILFFLFALLGILIYIYSNNIDSDSEFLSCDFENFDVSNEKIDFRTNKILNTLTIKNASVTDEEAFSGKHSIKIINSEFVNLYAIRGVHPNELYSVTILRKGGSAGLVVQEDKAENPELYKFSNHILDTLPNGWGRISVQIRIPNNFKGNVLKIYIWNPKKEPGYFDDFSIKKIKKNRMSFPEFKDIEPLYIFIEDKEFNKLRKIREKAFERGILITEEGSFVRALIVYEGHFMRAKIRLKGDWLDHLEGDKWSFRIKLIEDAWKGMTTFSIQSPDSRSYLLEWLFHKIALDKGILTTNYGFVPVYINNSPYGIYVYEEHFDKILLESKKRREAPILSLNEERMWNRRILDLNSQEEFLLASAYPEAFKMSTTMGDEGLYNCFIIGQNLLESFKQGELTASEVFDIPKTAKYFAYMSKFGAYHGAIWHNIRFYYNPVISKLEPIAYDCYSNWGINNWGLKEILGYYQKNDNFTFISGLYLGFFEDDNFRKQYYKELQKLQGNIIQEYYKKYESELTYYENLIKREYLGYVFDRDHLIKHSFVIDSIFSKLSNDISDKNYIDFIKNKKLAVKSKFNSDIKKEYFSDYVRFYKNSDNELGVIVNYHFNIDIIGFGDADKIRKSTKIELKNKLNTNFYKNTIKLDEILNKNYEYVYFTTPEYPGMVYRSKIIPWPMPVAFSPRKQFEETAIILNQYFKHTNNEIRIFGKKKFDKNIYIPDGYKVFIEPGTEIDLINNAAFVSNSPIFAEGTEEKPIKIHSSDGTGNGFTVLQAKDKSIFKNGIFENLNTLNYKGWQLTGAVTFYESDVEFYNCNFRNNHCEDFLNTIRSQFLLNNCIMENTFSDAFDSDFCRGKVVGCKFINSGNDAIDFSTSNVEILNCKIIKAGDKGISMGEKSVAAVVNTQIEQVNIGIASKDLSEIKARDIKIKNSNYGFVLLQKKPEFGPAKIIAEKIVMQKVKTEHKVEESSVLELNEKKIEGKNKNLKMYFY
ncbi:MAG: CotH kinase family protein [Bacteroidales bacterium]